MSSSNSSTGDACLQQIAAMTATMENQLPSPDECDYEQAIRGLIDGAATLQRLVAASSYFRDVVDMQVECPDLAFDVPDPMTPGGRTRISIPLGAVIRRRSGNADAAKKLTQGFFTLPQEWLVKEYAACLARMEQYFQRVKAVTAATAP
mgnify:CR=1 FL=1